MVLSARHAGRTGPSLAIATLSIFDSLLSKLGHTCTLHSRELNTDLGRYLLESGRGGNRGSIFCSFIGPYPSRF